MEINDRSYLALNLAAVVVIVGGLKLSGPVVVPLLVSAFIAMIAAPPVFWLEKRNVPAPLAVFGVVGVLVGFVSLISMVVAGSVDDFLASLPTYQARLKTEIGGLGPLAADLGLPVDLKAVQDLIDPGAAVGLVSNLLSGLGNVLTNGFLILLLVIFILFEASSLPAKVRRAFKDPDQKLEQFGELASKMNTYLAIKTYVSLGTGFSAALLCYAIGVDFPLVIGLLAFLLNYIPNIGSIIAAVPAILLAFVELGLGSAAATGIGFFAINTVFGNVIEPRFQGRGVGLSTFVVFFSLVFWGWLLGSVGMLLSIPLTMTLKLALNANPDTRWLAVLLGPADEPKTENSA